MKGASTTLRLEDIKLTVPEADRGVISTVVREHYPVTHYADAVIRQEQVTGVSDLAGVANRQAETVQVELVQTVNHVLERQGTPEFAREMDKVLRVIEERIPEAITDLGAITLEARLTDDWVTSHPCAVSASASSSWVRIARVVISSRILRWRLRRSAVMDLRAPGCRRASGAPAGIA